ARAPSSPARIIAPAAGGGRTPSRASAACIHASGSWRSMPLPPWIPPQPRRPLLWPRQAECGAIVDFLPIFLTLRDRRAVVIGGGAVAERKVELLLDAGARVHVVAPALSDLLQTLRIAGRISHRLGAFALSDLDEAAVVIAATDQTEVNAAAAEA